MHFGIYLEKWAIFWLFLRSSVLATSGYTAHFPCILVVQPDVASIEELKNSQKIAHFSK